MSSRLHAAAVRPPIHPAPSFDPQSNSFSFNIGMSSSTNISRRSRTAVSRAWSDRLAFLATVIAVCCVAGCDAEGCLIPPDGNGAVVIPPDAPSIPDNAFQGCTSLVSITIPDSVTSIGDYAFYGCTSLASVTIGDSVISIGRSAFLGCTSLASITIPDSVTSIGAGAFYDCTSLVSVTIGDSVISIGRSAFLGCTSLASVTIPDSVTSIGDAAFRGCISLASVTIPDSVSIGDAAFRECFCAESAYIAGAAFFNCTDLTTSPTAAPTCHAFPPNPAPTCPTFPALLAAPIKDAAAATYPSLSATIQAMENEDALEEFLGLDRFAAAAALAEARFAAAAALAEAAPLKAAAAATFPSLSGIIQAMGTKAELLAFLDGPAVTTTITAASQEAIAAADRCDRNPSCVEL